MDTSSRFRKLTRETANCETASAESVLYGQVPWGLAFDRVRSVRNETIVIAIEMCRFKLEVLALESE